MRNLTTRFICLLCLNGLLGTMAIHAQVLHRGKPTSTVEKIESVTDALPCGGSLIFAEDFENGIGAGWTIIDGDDRTPRPEMQLQKGWQGRADYRDSLNNKVAASPSWYVNPGKSNDWLISPVMQVGTNSCLSWESYSQDNFFKEAYEVRIASAPDTAAFLATAPVFSTVTELGTPNFHSVSLASYAGQNVYVAFRQTSDDKFVLCLDDVRLANVNAIDIGAYKVTYGTPDPGDTVRLRFEVANYGSDTIRSFQAYYSVDGGAPQVMNITAVSLAPNFTVLFNHDSLYISDSVDAHYDLCAWTSLPNNVADQDINNDTTCLQLTIGSPVSIGDPDLDLGVMSMFPNPCNDWVQLRIAGIKRPQAAVLTIWDLQGSKRQQQGVRLQNGTDLKLDLSDLAAGMYIATVDVPGGKRWQVKLIKQ